jgi:hypothetical protein
LRSRSELTKIRSIGGRAIESKPQIQFIPAIIKFLSHNPIPLPDSPGQRLVFYRQTHGITQRALANRIGVDPKAIGLSERGNDRFQRRLRKLLEGY